MLSLHSPHGKAPYLHASQFSSGEIFYKITSAFLKTGINLRNLPPAHSRGAVTFPGLCCQAIVTYSIVHTLYVIALSVISTARDKGSGINKYLHLFLVPAKDPHFGAAYLIYAGESKHQSR